MLGGSLGLAQDPAQAGRRWRSSASSRSSREREAADRGDKPAAAKDKKPGEVAPEDKDLDSLLEKLGETTDAPTPEDQPKRAGPGSKTRPPRRQAGQGQRPTSSKGEAKGLDEHLEELTGRAKKKKDRQKEQGEPSGPLSKVIKEMRDVEQRLGKTDTGEETRKKQAEIVKNLERLIEQLRESQSQSQGKKKAQLSMKPGNQPGPKGGQEQGAMAKGVGRLEAGEADRQARDSPAARTSGATSPPSSASRWSTSSRKKGCRTRWTTIRRYYLSLSKKILTREE